MRYPTRNHRSIDEQRKFSIRTAIDCSDKPDMARQEFKNEADTNWILARFNVNELLKKPLQFQDVDYTADLHTVHVAAEEAKRAYYKLPEHLREKYATWQDLFLAISTGELTTLEKPEEKPADPAASQPPGTAS